MSRSMTFRDPIHHVDYFVLIGVLNDFRKVVNKFHPAFHIDEGTAKTIYSINKGNRECYIYLNRLDIPCLAHEAVHAAIQMYNDIGTEVTEKTDEHLAYYVQWIVGTIYHHFKQKGFLCKKKTK